MRVGIYIPIYYREEAVKKCLDSIAKSDFGGIDVFLCLGINGASDEFKKKYIGKYYSQHNRKKFSSIHIFDPEKNLGKPSLINMMVKKYSNFDYIVTIDSDMVSVDIKWLKKMLYTFDYYRPIDSDKLGLGAICSNQSGNNCHFVQNTKYCIRQTVANGLTLVYNKENLGVAGGLLMSPRSVWNKLKGYRAFNIYGSDDGFYAHDCRDNKLIMAYLDEVPFFHPFSDDENYSQWKLRAAKNQLSEDEKEGYYENLRSTLGEVPKKETPKEPEDVIPNIDHVDLYPKGKKNKKYVLNFVKYNKVFDCIQESIEEYFSGYQEYSNCVFVLGYNCYKDLDFIRENYNGHRIIIVQMEQLHKDSVWWNKNTIEMLKNADQIWDYDENNIKFLSKNGISAKLFNLPYTKSLIRIPEVEAPDIDFLIYGYMNDRRSKIIQHFQSVFKGRKIITLFNVWGDELDEYISRSKVILNIHYFKDVSLQEQARIYYLLLNNKCVLSENSATNYFGDSIIEDSYENLVEKAKYLMKDDTWKKYASSSREKFLEIFNSKNSQ